MVQKTKLYPQKYNSLLLLVDWKKNMSIWKATANWMGYPVRVVKATPIICVLNLFWLTWWLVQCYNLNVNCNCTYSPQKVKELFLIKYGRAHSKWWCYGRKRQDFRVTIQKVRKGSLPKAWLGIYPDLV